MQTDAIKVAHNAIYDLGWLYAEGIDVKGPIVDTMLMAPILNENKFSYALSAVGKDMLGEIKDETLLKQAATEFGIDPKNEMYKLPAIFVGDYAEQDADLTLRLFHHMRPLIEKQSLNTVYKLEMNLTRREVFYDGNKVDFTKMEFDFLNLLAESPNRAFSREEILNKVWGYENYPTTRTVDTHVLQLRQKLRDDLIETVRGIGYKLVEK